MANNGDEHNRGGLIAFTFSIGFCLLFFVYISFIHPGINLKEVSEEAAAPAPGAGAEVEVDVSKIKEPWLENPDMVKYGAKVFKNNCAICHGNEGKGDGPAGLALNPKPRNIVEGKWKQGGTTVDLFKTLQTGIPGSSMASFKHLPKLDRWGLVQFIHSITQNKVADDKAKLTAFGPTGE